MKKYSFCSKIQEDTRIPEGGYAEMYFDKGTRVSVFREASGSMDGILSGWHRFFEAMGTRSLRGVFYWFRVLLMGEVCHDGDFYRKSTKKFKI